MGIGTKAGLFNAATGKMPKRTITPPKETPDPYAEARKRRQTLAQTSAERMGMAAAQQGAANITGGMVGDPNALSAAFTPTYGSTPTATYKSLIGSVTRGSGGLSKKGKYGGFYSASDLEAAIKGSATGFRDQSVEGLRRAALERYGQLDPMYQEALSKGRSGMLGEMGFKPQAPASAAGARMFEEVSSLKPQPIKEYAQKLGSWYAEQAKPAEEYLQTAQQIEATPLSELATSIAVSQYGMNPDLARGKFAGLDAEYWQKRRDDQYMQTYGMPYSQYQSLVQEGEQQERQRQAGEQYAQDQAKASLEALTGFRSNTISSLTGQTPEQLYNRVLSRENIVYKDPATDQDVQNNSAGVVQEVSTLIANDDVAGAKKILDSVDAVEGQEEVARLIRAMLYMGFGKKANVEQDLDLYLAMSGL